MGRQTDRKMEEQTDRRWREESHTIIEKLSKYFNLISDYLHCKREFVDCPLVEEKSIGSNPIEV
jgi:hypothetical protein